MHTLLRGFLDLLYPSLRGLLPLQRRSRRIVVACVTGPVSPVSLLCFCDYA